MEQNMEQSTEAVMFCGGGTSQGIPPKQDRPCKDPWVACFPLLLESFLGLSCVRLRGIHPSKKRPGNHVTFIGSSRLPKSS